MSNAWEGSGKSGCWNSHFSRHFNDWELEEVEGLFRKLHPLVVRREVKDVLSWKESRDDIFSVRSLYHFFTRAYSDPFAWEASWNRNLTIYQLKKRGWNMLNRCYLCKEKEEISDHLILFCEKATMFWSLIFSLFGV